MEHREVEDQPEADRVRHGQLGLRLSNGVAEDEFERFGHFGRDEATEYPDEKTPIAGSPTQSAVLG